MTEESVSFEEAKKRYVDTFGPRTEAIENFFKDLEQSFQVATLIAEAGHVSRNQILEEFNMLIKEKEDVEVLSMNDTDIMAYYERLQALKKRADDLVRLGEETTPNILFTFEITKFEAYIEDILVLLYNVRPDLIEVAEAEKRNKKKKPESDIVERVQDLLSNEAMDWIGRNIFEKSLNIPLSNVYRRALTSAAELDKAKGIRNIHLHNKGIVNRRNKDRIGLDVNTPCPITMAYATDIKNKILFTVFGIDVAASIKYPAILSR
jgi:hypothetical protein